MFIGRERELETLNKLYSSNKFEFMVIYGRRTAQMKIVPFEFEEACRYFQNFSDEDKALLYGIVGGTPQYLLQINDKLSVEDNIKMCSAYVKNLVALGVIRKETPYGEKAPRKAIYVIEDNLFRFWYRFVPENNSIIARGAADLAYRRIEPFLPDYMGKVFEEICKQYLWRRLLAGKCQVQFSSLGRWWGNDPREKRQAEIDILGEQDKDTALFGGCKWTNEKVDLGVLETLVKRSELFPYRHKHFYLFSKSGFTKECMDQAKEMGNVVLVRYEEIL